MKKFLLVVLATVLTTLSVACGNYGDTELTLNPYENVDWAVYSHVMTNLHTHTDADDGHGKSLPHEAVDLYYDAGYRILALTDHDMVTYPWTFSGIDPAYEDRDPAALGMLDIPGNEYSRHHHFVGLFTEHEAPFTTSVEATMRSVLNNSDEAVMFLAHPGRYWDINKSYTPGELYSPGWYLNLFDEFTDNELVGIEVYNTNNRYPFDTHLWDRLLMESMPERTIWAFSNDDFHGEDASEIGWSRAYHLLEDPLSKAEFRDSIVTGAFYVSSTREAGATPPTVVSISINDTRKTITLEVEGDYDQIRWISGIDEDNLSKVVATGATFEYGHFEGNYVRAAIVYEEGRRDHAMTLTQPFGFSQED